MSYKVKCTKCGRINKVRKLPNKPTYEMKCECGAIGDIKSEIFAHHSKDDVISFVLKNPHRPSE